MSHAREWKHDWKAKGDVAKTQKHYLREVPPGPWDTEPDKIQWVDDATGLDCLMHRGPMGQWCGYVGVPEGHPAFEKDYDDVDVQVHGGLTYASLCQNTKDESVGVCHVPEPGRPHKVWWLGFDCAHAFDLAPGMLPLRLKMKEEDPALWERLYVPREDDPLSGETYRDRAYVEQEVTQLAQQLAKMAA